MPKNNQTLKLLHRQPQSQPKVQQTLAKRKSLTASQPNRNRIQQSIFIEIACCLIRNQLAFRENTLTVWQKSWTQISLLKKDSFICCLEGQEQKRVT